MRQKSLFIGAMAWLWVLVFPSAALARSADLDPSLQCDAAAAQAAQRSGVPLSVMLSIARVESGQATGGELRPWPWTINAGGQGHFFATKAEAMEFAATQIGKGDINFDVGCFQVNLRWHSKGFTSLDNAFDPMANAAYAAQFLASLYAQQGDWSGAVAAYHSRTPEYAERYLDKVKSVWQGLKRQDVRPPEQPVVNGYPLLQAGQGAGGSIVPQFQMAQPQSRLILP